MKSEDITFNYILPVPVLGTLIFILNIAPFYATKPANALYVEVLCICSFLFRSALS